MSKKIIAIFEDEKYTNFYPLSYLHPVFELKSGIFSFKKRLEYFFPHSEIVAFGREILNKVLPYELSPFIDNENSTILFLNGRIFYNDEIHNVITNLDDENLLIVDKNTEDILALQIDINTFEDTVHEFMKTASTITLKEILQDKIKILTQNWPVANYPWDLVAKNSEQIILDVKFIKQNNNFTLVSPSDKIAIIGSYNVYKGKNVTIEPFVTFDTNDGPIILGDNALITSFSHITGPTYIGKNSKIFQAQIREGVSIGENCRIGGEVEESIFHGFDNKYHYGFIGHSYIGEWVNLGAGTTNSDLKNNYSNIKYQIEDKIINSGLMKAGAIIGDFTKTGIGTLINTGTIIGIFCNIFNTTELPKNVASFSWGKNSSFQIYQIDKCIKTTKTVMERRDVQITNELIDLIQFYYGEI